MKKRGRSQFKPQISQATHRGGPKVRYCFYVNGNNTSVGTYLGGTRYHSASVSLDDIGNVEQRISHYRNPNGNYQHFTENYAYDNLNRLERRTLTLHSGSLPSDFRSTLNVEYDVAGNISYKSDKGEKSVVIKTYK